MNGSEGPGAGFPPPAPRKYLDRAMDGAARELYRRLEEDGRPATTRCPTCEETRFPPLERCPGCGGEVEWVELAQRGALHAFTTQETALRFAAPAVLALVELGEVVVPAIALADHSELRIGDEVEIEVFAEPETGLSLLRALPVDRAARR